jgi:hypothetical protein
MEKELTMSATLRLFLIASAVLVVVSVFGVADVQAQGCVASRMSAPGGVVDTEGTSYYVPKKGWQASFGFRGFRSHRHFVGDVEQNAENTAKGLAERDRSGSEVINHSYLNGFSLTYGVSDRLSINAELPYVVFRRKSPANATRALQTTNSKGIGDLNMVARYWLGKPNGHASQNLALGLGFKAPTGNDRYEDEFVTFNPQTGVRTSEVRSVDQSIQPGDGGWGLYADFSGFKAFGKVTAFASGSYMANPREENDFFRNPFAATQDPLSGKLSITDQYTARLGLGTAVKKFGFSLAARMEGVPSSDLIGGSNGRRRPGYSIALEPGVSYSWKRNSLSVSVPYLVRRVRTQNVSDKAASIESGHKEIGDAAFADYVISVGYSRRF